MNEIDLIIGFIIGFITGWAILVHIENRKQAKRRQEYIELQKTVSRFLDE